MRLRVLLVLVATLWGASLTAPASAAPAPYPPAGTRVVAGTVTPLVVENGGTVTFSGGGFAAFSVLSIAVDGNEVATVNADQNGNFSTRVTLQGLGNRQLTATGIEADGRQRVVTATARVEAARGAQPGTGTGNNNAGAGNAGTGGLPTTGSEVLPALLAGLGFVVVGASIVHLARRRRVLA